MGFLPGSRSPFRYGTHLDPGSPCRKNSFSTMNIYKFAEPSAPPLGAGVGAGLTPSVPGAAREWAGLTPSVPGAAREWAGLTLSVPGAAREWERGSPCWLGARPLGGSRHP